jgi:hypothetical protein
MVRYVPARDGRELHAIDDDGSARRLQLFQDQTQHRGLAGTAGPDEEDELSGLYSEVYVLQSRYVSVIDLGDVVEVDQYLLQI